MNSQNKKTIGKTGILPDGRLVIMRGTSSDGRATLQTYDLKTHSATIIKYNESDRVPSKHVMKNEIPMEETVEQWKQWHPLENVAPKYTLNKLMYENKALTIILDAAHCSKADRIKLQFSKDIIEYRSSNELFRFGLICDLEDIYGTEFYGAWTFFTVENSTYIEFVVSQSSVPVDCKKLLHFSLITEDSVIDIITDHEPTIEQMRTEF
jgi:hypothetical protein